MLDYLLMVLMALLWAGAFIVGKFSVSMVPPEMVAFLRFLVAGVVLLGIVAVWQRESLRVQRQHWWLVGAMGATGIAGYNLLFYYGLQLTRASDGAMIIPTLNPVLILFASALFLGEPLTRRKLAGAAVSVAGQAFIFWTLIQAAVQDPNRLLGDLFYLGSALCWAAYGVLSRMATRRLTPLQSTTWSSVSGAVMLLPFALWVLPGSAGYTPVFWGQIAYMGIGSTVVGFFLFIRGIHRLGASRAAVFMNLVPVCTVILAYLVLGETISWQQAMGIGLVLSGVYLASARPGGAPAKAA